MLSVQAELPFPAMPRAVGTLLGRAAYGKGWSGGGIVVSNAAFFLPLMVDQLIQTESMFKLLRVRGELSPKRGYLRGA